MATQGIAVGNQSLPLPNAATQQQKRFEKVEDAETGETVLLTKPASSVKITGGDGQVIVDAAADNRMLELLAAKQRAREAERDLAMFKQREQETAHSDELSKLRAEIEKAKREVEMLKGNTAASEAKQPEAQSLKAPPEKEPEVPQESTEKLNNNLKEDNTPTPMSEAEFEQRVAAYHEKKKAEEAAAEQAKQAAEQAKKAEEERIQKLVDARLEAAMAAKKGTKRKETPAAVADDDAWSDDDEDEAMTQKKEPSSGEYEKDLKEIQESFGEYSKKLKRYQTEHEKFLKDRKSVDKETAALREQKFIARKQKLDSMRDALVEMMTNKALKYEKETNGKVKMDLSGLAELSASEQVDQSFLENLQKQAVAVASSFNETRNQQRTLLQAEKEVFELRKQNALKDLELKRARIFNESEQSANSVDPAYRAQNMLKGAAHAMLPKSSDLVPAVDKSKFQPAALQYMTPGRFVAVSSSLSKKGETNQTEKEFKEQEKTLPKFVFKGSALANVPGGFGVGRGFVFHPPPALDAGMGHSPDPVHQHMFKKLLEERDKFTRNKGTLMKLEREDYLAEASTLHRDSKAYEQLQQFLQN